MKLHFLGAAETVTGSKYLLETHERTLLIDCGLYQGYKELRERNWHHLPAFIQDIDAVLITHAHIDHTGYLPILVRDGFKGPIYATQATIDLCEILLRDSGRLQEEDARRANKYGYSKHKIALPLYTEEEAIAVMRQFKPIPFGQDIALGKELIVHASRAGHILGSAIFSVRAYHTTIVFTGDLGRESNPIMKSPAEIQKADFLVLDSTYGDRLHPQEDVLQEMASVINSTAKKGGTIVIPAFAVGRTQMILYYLQRLVDAKAIPQIPIYLDSPMAQDATGIMERHHAEHDLSDEMCERMCKLPNYVNSFQESLALHKDPMPKIILSASGMLEGGRVLNHIKYYGPDPSSCILFTSFQAPMTRGDKILRGAAEIKMFGEHFPIRARIKMLESLSAHADQQETLEWLSHLKKPPVKVFLTHGEPSSTAALKQAIEKRFEWAVEIPKYLDIAEL